MGQGCAISVADVFNGHLASGMLLNASYWTDKPPINTQIGDFAVNFVCRHVTDQSKEQVANQYGGSYDVKRKKWVAYYDGERDRKLLSPVSRLYPIKTDNSSGFVRTTDEIIGDPDQRVRFFSYCLFHDAQAICGDGQVMKLADPKGNLLPYALEILRSVEFIDPTVIEPAAPANPASTLPQ
jgi:hypothetical protein